jgi:hypothetical protein
MSRSNSGCLASFTFLLGQEYMGQGRLSHTICLQFLLIASAIQGVTPDARDLASIKALWLFCPVLAEANSLADDDGLPDEVCGPAQSAANLIFRTAKSGDVSHPASASTESLLPTLQSSARRSVYRHRCSARIDDLIYALCRINC